jgi:hypothetical protein
LSARRRRTTLLRLAWFVGLWGAGVVVVAVIGYVVRQALGM